jgi:YfiH family protein
VFAFQDTRGRVDVAFTDRHGGSRGGPFASLNLGEPRGASPEVLAEARSTIDTVARALGVPRVVRMSQVHGSDVAVIDGSGLDTAAETPPVADGLVTALPGVALLVRVADCVPVLLADPVRGVVGAAHAGRAGMVAGIVPRTVAAMRELGAEEVTAWVGPHVCGGCYEVPDAMRSAVAASVPEAYAETTWGTPALDVGAGVRAQLSAAGTEVVDASRCTLEDEELYSYRRQGPESGRLGGLVWVRR